MVLTAVSVTREMERSDDPSTSIFRIVARRGSCVEIVMRG